MIVYCVSIEDDHSGMVDWFPEREAAERDYVDSLVAFPDDEVNLFEVDVGDTPEDFIICEVDGVMWDRSYTPIRWRAAAPGNHSAQPHDTPPTDPRPA